MEKRTLSDVKDEVNAMKRSQRIAAGTIEDVMNSDKPAYFLMSDGTFTTVHKAEELGEVDDVRAPTDGWHFDDRCPDVKIALGYFDTDVYTAAKNILISMTESKDFSYAVAEDVWKKIYTDDPSKLKNFDARNADAEEIQEEIEIQVWHV